jgi:TolB protein
MRFPTLFGLNGSDEQEITCCYAISVINMKKSILLIILIIHLFSCNEGTDGPDGNGRVFFITRRIPNSADWQIYVMDFTGESQHRAINKIVNYARPGISYTSRKIAFTTYENQYNLYISNLDGTDMKLIASSQTFCGAQTWSPDGSRLLYLKGRTNERIYYPVVYDVNADQENILIDSSDYTSPKWLSSDEVLLIPAADRSIIRYNILNKTRVKISAEEILFADYALSPDGKVIAATSACWEGSQIFLLNIDGSDLRQITTSVSPDWFDTGFAREGNGSPSWSRDGKNLAFVSYGDGDAEIFIADANGTNMKQITFNEDYDGDPVWSNDGQFIFFSSNRDRSLGNYDIFRMNATGNNVLNVTRSPGNDALPFVY